MEYSLSLDDVFEDSKVLFYAGVGALLLHGRDVTCLEIDDAAVETGLVYLVEEFSGGVEVVCFFRRDGLHL